MSEAENLRLRFAGFIFGEIAGRAPSPEEATKALKLLVSGPGQIYDYALDARLEDKTNGK